MGTRCTICGIDYPKGDAQCAKCGYVTMPKMANVLRAFGYPHHAYTLEVSDNADAIRWCANFGQALFEMSRSA